MSQNRSPSSARNNSSPLALEVKNLKKSYGSNTGIRHESMTDERPKLNGFNWPNRS